MLNNSLLSYLQKATIYEVNTRQFSVEGDFASLQKHLPRLKEMGVDILWMMPVHPIGIRNRKGSLGSYYSSRDFFEVNPEYGTKEDFKNLVDEVHSLGMKIIIDWVANHAAWDNAWVETNPEYFLRDDSGNFVSPYDWSDVIQVNHAHEAAHDAMRSAMLYWIKKFDIDGFRADLAHLTPLHFWIRARQEAELVKPGLIWLAETEDPEYYRAFDISYAWKWMHQSETFFRHGHSIDSLHTLLTGLQTSNLPTALQLYFTTNHDENSWNGTEYEKYGQYAKALSVFSFTYPGAVPLIYSGQEIPNLRRLAFFDKDALEWNETPQLHTFYQTLTTWRRNNKAGDEMAFFHSDKRLLAFRRGSGEQVVLVFLNLDKEPIDHIIDAGQANGRYRNVFSGELVFIDDDHVITLAPGEYLVLDKTA